MPPKAKPSSTAKEAASKAPELPEPTTLAERTRHRFYQTNPLEKRREEAGGIHALTPLERQTYVNASLVPRVLSRDVILGNKADREFWKFVSKESLPARRLSRQQRDYTWGEDRLGRDLGALSITQNDQRAVNRARLSALEALHRRFLQKRELAAKGYKGPDGVVCENVSDAEVEEEKLRRKDMATLRKDLYGEKMGPYATDPEWDDVVPIPVNDPEGALAAIAYPEDYAEAIGYLRAIMAAEECSPRALRLTEHIIEMNPAHYTVWLYRFRVVQKLEIALDVEFKWLNGVSLEHLKNYQIWHHRQLLLDRAYAAVADQPDAVRKLAREESEFLRVMLEEDTKNYHVWSYRQYLVRRLGMWNAQELGATQSLIEDDVRNNSAWSHRFFLVFSDPNASTPGSYATEHDPAVPASVVDRELNYAREKTLIAPQNQAAWNYLRGVLVKGGRPLAEAEEFASQFARGVGEGDAEEVRSSHALDFLADVYVEKGEGDKAAACLDRLADKWDPVRAGYWKYRKQQIPVAA
ncbi:prenyltransferase alpha subunit [Plectosphaerella plurivora]|uniref:Protein farnesyltransferase/geranylgeranyltransferase type-1 subunit alpha n=1 Tax=Plectosphaerella plurivora TaxID=936078 RepID=A0A9P9ADU6_9PEZI|nr:prenyltransferase alpha subunit [Plectosphaerella plurivora]